MTNMEPSLAVPTVIIEPHTQTTYGGMIPDIRPDICAQVLRAWGVDDATVGRTSILVTPSAPATPQYYDFKNDLMYTGVKFTEQEPEGNGLMVHLGNIVPMVSRMPHIERARQMSRWLLEGLSRRADYALMGEAAISAENRRVARRPAVKEIIKSSMQGVGWSGAAAVADVLFVQNHFGLFFKVATGTAGIVGALEIAWRGYRNQKVARNHQVKYRNATEDWPIDQRARERARLYISEDRALPITGVWAK